MPEATIPETPSACIRHGARRTRAQWSNTQPSAVAAGSKAQILYCIQDARADILSLYAEIDQLRWELANATRT